MALFPMFVDIKEYDCLIVGGGEVALRKIEQLVKFSPVITVIAPVVHPQIHLLASQFTIKVIDRVYQPEDLIDRSLVIAALNDYYEQEKIYRTCLSEKIPVNCVDSPELCSFIFPALIVDRELCIGITTSGRAPAVSSALRKFITKFIPDGIHDLIECIHRIREHEPSGKNRQNKIITMCQDFFEHIPTGVK